MTMTTPSLERQAMYSVYAVALRNGEKDRRYVGATENEFEARHMANVATCSWADYAYVKAFGGGTVFYLEKPGKEAAGKSSC